MISFLLFTYSENQKKALEAKYDPEFCQKFKKETELDFYIGTYEDLFTKHREIFGLKMIEYYYLKQ